MKGENKNHRWDSLEFMHLNGRSINVTELSDKEKKTKNPSVTNLLTVFLKIKENDIEIPSFSCKSCIS